MLQATLPNHGGIECLESRQPQLSGTAFGQDDSRSQPFGLATKTVLLCGHDGHVTDTRRMLLEADGYQVFVAAELKEALQSITNSPGGILVIRHTVPPRDARKLSLTARTCRPLVKILFPATGRQASHHYLGDEIHGTLAGPARFLQKVRGMAMMNVPGG